MKKFKGLIFDFNGVLLLDQHLHDEIWTSYAEKIVGRRPSEDEIKNIFHGRDNKGILEYLYQKELSTDEVERHAREKELTYQRTAQSLGSEYRLASGAVELLTKLQERKILFTIATSSPKMNVDFFNETLGLDTWFAMDKVAYVGGTLRGKPSPDLYLRAAEFLALKPEDCIVIEDARSGIAAAHAAGIGHIIAIGPKESHERLKILEGVSEVVERLDEVDVKRLF